MPRAFAMRSPMRIPKSYFIWRRNRWSKESYRDPLGTYATNVLGTAAVLDACRELKGLRCAIVVTSDKVYENRGIGRPFEEGDRLGGCDPYSSSKAGAELVTESFRESFSSAGVRCSRRCVPATSSAEATGPRTG